MASRGVDNRGETGPWTLAGDADRSLLTFKGQLRALARAGIRHIELRSIGRTPLLSARPSQLRAAQNALAAAGIQVSSIGTDIGLVPVTGPFAPQMEALKGAIDLAHRFGAPRVRVASFLLPRKEDPDAHRRTVLGRIDRFADLAADERVTLWHRNIPRTFGSTPGRCAALAKEVDGPLRLVLDPSACVAAGVAPAIEALPVVLPWLDAVELRDVRGKRAAAVRAGAGDAQLPALIRALAVAGFRGTVVIVPSPGGTRASNRLVRAAAEAGALLTAAGVQTR